MRIKLRKLPKKLWVGFLALGASTTLALLSFTGMGVISPLLGLGLSATFFAVTFDGQIYFQFIRNALDKLGFKKDELKKSLANEFMLKKLLEEEPQEQDPEIIKEYRASVLRYQYLCLLEEEGSSLWNEGLDREKEWLRLNIRDLQLWFSIELFNTDPTENLRPAQAAFRTWFKSSASAENADDNTDVQEELIKRFSKETFYRKLFRWLSIFSGISTGFGTLLLLIQQLAAIGFIASLPFGGFMAIVVPLAVFAGMAAAYITFNALCDLYHNDTIKKWFYKLQKDFFNSESKGRTVLAALGILLIPLSLIFTLLSIGTWFTIMKIPGSVGLLTAIPMGVMAILAGITNLPFVIENSSNTYKAWRHKLDNLSIPEKMSYKDQSTIWLNKNSETQHTAQIFNPIAFFETITYKPLVYLFFGGHAAGSSLTADRFPGLPLWLSTLAAFFSSIFADFGIFFPMDEHNIIENNEVSLKKTLKVQLDANHHHDHGDSLPHLLLRALFWPVRVLKIGWHMVGSWLNKDPEKHLNSYAEAKKNYYAMERKETYIKNPPAQVEIKAEWQREHALLLAGKAKVGLEEVTFGKAKALAKLGGLNRFQEDLQNIAKEEPPPENLRLRLKDEKSNGLYNCHRLFQSAQPSRTQAKIAALEERVFGSAIPTP